MAVILILVKQTLKTKMLKTKEHKSKKIEMWVLNISSTMPLLFKVEKKNERKYSRFTARVSVTIEVAGRKEQ